MDRRPIPTRSPSPASPPSAAAPAGAASPEPAGQPWYHQPMMWLVVGGPAAVVVAAIVTAVIAVRGADPVIDTRADRFAEQPAREGRNHAATPQTRP